jgi:hypothetical protein
MTINLERAWKQLSLREATAAGHHPGAHAGAVCGSELSHNAAGRVHTLAMLLETPALRRGGNHLLEEELQTA